MPDVLIQLAEAAAGRLACKLVELCLVADLYATSWTDSTNEAGRGVL